MSHDALLSPPLVLPEGLRLEGVSGAPRGRLPEAVEAVLLGGDVQHAWVIAGEYAVRVEAREGAVVDPVVSERHRWLRHASRAGGVVLRAWEGEGRERRLRVLEGDGSVREVMLPEMSKPRARIQEAFDEIVVGRDVVVARRGNQVFLVEPVDGTVRAQVRFRGRPLRVALAPDEGSFALWCEARVELRDAVDGRLRWRADEVRPFHEAWLHLVFEPAGGHVLVEAQAPGSVAGQGRVMLALDAATGVKAWSLALEPGWERVRLLCVDAGEGRAACVMERRVVFYEVARGALAETCVFVEEGGQIPEATLAGGLLVVAGDQTWGRISLEGRSLEPPACHRGAVGAVVLSPEGGKLATVDGEHAVRVWREDGTWLAGIEGPVAFVVWLDAETLMAVAGDGRARAFATDGSLLAEEVLAGWAIEAACVAAGGEAVVVVGRPHGGEGRSVVRCLRKGQTLEAMAHWTIPERHGAGAVVAASGEVVVLLASGTKRWIVRLDPETLAERRRTELPVQVEVKRDESWSIASSLGGWSVDRAGTTLLTRLSNRGGLVRWDLALDAAGPELPASRTDDPDVRSALGKRWAIWRLWTRVQVRDAVTGEVRATVAFAPGGDVASSVELSHDERTMFIGTRSGGVLRVRIEME
ncbi:PQQ-binding-like beta-propeller repeat protein [Chondromyces crocatus]|uniref:Pyrrolo-quinoline quinone repeat domain-containing protein n=1 Tax=Chondromyces crocatus TaxID=52 RepID=A0A0K1EF94_CHOCO|nr:PQQ-binding-like beta-propeller repeat protein [Chondromyces crocatus]AKT39540.1 uncharacterized protein CMC5_036870 [Chondromyces crocatus]